METTTINFALKQPSGLPVAGGKVSFVLTGYDLDAAIILPTSIEANIGTGGTGSIAVWPNVFGLKATTYKVTITSSQGQGQKLEIVGVIVPESDTSVALHMLVPTGAVGGLKTVVLTQTDYDALTVKDAQTLYLIRAE